MGIDGTAHVLYLGTSGDPTYAQDSSGAFVSDVPGFDRRLSWAQDIGVEPDGTVHLGLTSSFGGLVLEYAVRRPGEAWEYTELHERSTSGGFIAVAVRADDVQMLYARVDGAIGYASRASDGIDQDCDGQDD